MHPRPPILRLGDPGHFAIESALYWAFDGPPDVNAYGFFRLHVQGSAFGFLSDNASWIKVLYGQTRVRIESRGSRRAPFADAEDPALIMESYRVPEFAEVLTREEYFGLPARKACDYCRRAHWEADEGFYDGSYVLQFDVADRVRIVAAMSCGDPDMFVRDTVREAWMSSDYYYGMLNQWCEATHAEWLRMPRVSKETYWEQASGGREMPEWEDRFR